MTYGFTCKSYLSTLSRALSPCLAVSEDILNGKMYGEWETVECSALNGMYMSHPFTQSPGKPSQRSGWKDRKRWRWGITSRKASFKHDGAAVRTNAQQLWLRACDLLELDKIPAWRGDQGRTHKIPPLRVRAAGRGRVKLSLVEQVD